MTNTLPPWTRFERVTLPQRGPVEALEYAEKVARDFGGSVGDAHRMLLDIERNEEIWANSRYQVNIRVMERDEDEKGFPPLLHLSIKRLDKQPLGPEHYRDLMLIKDELVGPEHEGVELYPARSREADTANQFHLFVLADDGIRFPFGFRDGRHVQALQNGVGSAGARQAPFEPHHPHD